MDRVEGNVSLSSPDALTVTGNEIVQKRLTHTQMDIWQGDRLR